MTSVLVVGGTGLLGYHTIRELQARNYDVTSLSLPPMPARNVFGREVENVLGDVMNMADAELLELLSGQYAVVYAAGADERTIPPAPAGRFFYEQNVVPVQRVARLARAAGVRKFVLFNSYTAEFAELWPDLGYTTRNGYPRTRLLQEEVAFFEGAGQMDVMSLRLPFIFGSMPGRIPLWQMFIDIVRSQPGVVAVQKGATSAVTVKQVAQATVGAIERGEHGGRYAINGYDLSYVEFHELVCEALGRDRSDVQVVPLEAVLPTMRQVDQDAASRGTEHGIHVVDSALFQERDAVSDPGPTMAALGYEPDDVVQAIRDTLQVCLKRERALSAVA